MGEANSRLSLETNPFAAGVQMTVLRYRSRCRACQWESKDCRNNSEAVDKFVKHARKHLAIETIEREVKL